MSRRSRARGVSRSARRAIPSSQRQSLQWWEIDGPSTPPTPTTATPSITTSSPHPSVNNEEQQCNNNGDISSSSAGDQSSSKISNNENSRKTPSDHDTHGKRNSGDARPLVSDISAEKSSRIAQTFDGNEHSKQHHDSTVEGHEADGDRTLVPAYNFSFAMGGWLMIYNFGVAKCLLDHGLHAVHPDQTIIGSSAGSLAAAAVVLEADVDEIVEQVKASFVPRAHAAKFFGFVYGMFHIGTFLQESMLDCLPVERVAEKVHPGRLIVVMASLLGWNPIRARDIITGDELVDALRCSCAVFPLVMPHRFRGKPCFDGAFAEGTTSPTLSEDEAGGLETITISPLYASRASIKPSRYVPLSWIALPPNDPDAIDWLYDLGYRDALFWMAKQGIGHTCAHEQHTFGAHEDERRSAVDGGNVKNGDISTDAARDDKATLLSSPSHYSSAESLPSQPSRSELAASAIKEKWKRAHKDKADSYLRASFALSGCDMRPRRDKHPQLDAEIFVPSLKQFVGHGTYHGALDLAFVLLFIFVWKPVAALLIYVDLTARFVFAVCRGVGKELRPMLWWVLPTIVLLAVLCLEDVTPTRGDGSVVISVLSMIVFARGRQEGSLSEHEWRRAKKHLKGLLEYRVLLRCLPWGGSKHAVQSEALESSLLYRAAAFFM